VVKEAKSLRKKYLFFGLALILAIIIPIVAGAITQTQTIHVSGNANYPHNTPPSSLVPTPTPAPAASLATPNMQFSLFFSNGTAYPSSVTGAIGGVNTVVVDPLSGHNGGWIPTCVVVKNDGNVPIMINASLANKNIPENMDLSLNCGYFGTVSGGYGADKATSQQPIQPGQTYYMSLIAFLTPKSNYTPDQKFSYGYDVVITASQA
jgi:hypothetical protein